MGFGAVLFDGNIGFYGHSGFTYARNFGIRYHDLPEGANDSFFLCKELSPGYLDGITGVYQTPQGYYVDDADVEEFDKTFQRFFCDPGDKAGSRCHSVGGKAPMTAPACNPFWRSL